MGMMCVMGRPSKEDRLALARQRMLDHDLWGRGIHDKCVLEVMMGVPREVFIPEHMRSQAYDDNPLPIGRGQTISQPYIVALMTEVLHITPDCEVLEIGTGSGYQTAVLACLARKVYSMERLEDLSLQAQGVLKELGYTNITFNAGDGSRGWPEPRTYDRIMITAAVPRVPEPLWEQLKVGGRLVAPVGWESAQSLVLQEKTKTGKIETEICQVRFVRLYGAYGFSQ
jgi:protein-L-isoaspartate(D-aspartate) O-methyltransferase